MIIVAGSLQVDPAVRDAYVADCVEVVRQARAAPGCLDFALTADSLDPGRVVVHERWDDEASLQAFRGAGPSSDQQAEILDAHVRRYGISAEGPP